jgi:CRISPR-associated endoribonuclease Cas6
MLLSLVITMTPIETQTLSSQTGSKVHGWFLHAVERLDAAASSALHRPNEIRPFTVSEVWQGESPPQRVQRFVAGELYWLRITSIDTRLSTLLIDKWLPKLPPLLEIEHVKFALLDKFSKANEHPWAAESTWETLCEVRSRPLGSLEVEFVSPTLFRSDKKLLPFPLPHLVFGNFVGNPTGLAAKWLQGGGPIANGLFDGDGPALLPALDSYIASNIVIQGYDLHTLALSPKPVEHAREVGCVGLCRYQLHGRTEDAQRLQRAIHRLAAFAFFAGVGKHTAMGFGQARKKL